MPKWWNPLLNDPDVCVHICPRGAYVDYEKRECVWRDSCTWIDMGIANQMDEACRCSGNSHMVEDAGEW